MLLYLVDKDVCVGYDVVALANGRSASGLIRQDWRFEILTGSACDRGA